MNSMGNAIRLCRQQRRLSIPALAKKAGLSASYISLLERNERDPPYSTLAKLSAALDVPLSILVFIGTPSSELKMFPPTVADKLAAVSMKLLQASADNESEPALV